MSTVEERAMRQLLDAWRCLGVALRDTGDAMREALSLIEKARGERSDQDGGIGR